MTYSIMTFSIMTFSIKKLSVKLLSIIDVILILSIDDTHHNNTR